MKAKYFVAQHINDILRNEPKNIGVFVEMNDQKFAKFFGEAENLELDRRKLKAFNANVYVQWISYWRKAMTTQPFEHLISSSKANYRVIEGGEVTDVGGDTTEEIVQNLYSLLVSDGGYYEITAPSEDMQSVTSSLENELSDVFKENDLLSENVKHPLQRKTAIEGNTIIHKPAYTQVNGQLTVIEVVDFTLQSKVRSRDHAGYSAFMFNDISGRSSKIVEPISVVKVREQDQESEDVKNGLIILQNTSNVFNWLIQDERNRFIEERKKVAYTTI